MNSKFGLCAFILINLYSRTGFSFSNCMFVYIILLIAYFIRLGLGFIKSIPLDWTFNHSGDLSFLAASCILPRTSTF